MRMAPSGGGFNGNGQLGLGIWIAVPLLRNCLRCNACGGVMNNELSVSSASDLEMIWVEPGTFTMGKMIFRVLHLSIMLL